MSVLNQKMDEQMPYFKPGGSGLLGVTHAPGEKVCSSSWLPAPGSRLLVMGFGSTSPPPLLLLLLHSSIKMRSGVSKTLPVPVPVATEAAFGPGTPGPSVYLLLTQKRPRGRIAMLLVLKRDLECATALSGCRLLIIRCPHWRNRGCHCRNSSVCGSNTCRGSRNNVHRNLQGLMAAQHGI